MQSNDMSQRLEPTWMGDARLVATLRDAYIVLQTIRFPLVLAAEKLDDGTGYELADWATKQEVDVDRRLAIDGKRCSGCLLWRRDGDRWEAGR